MESQFCFFLKPHTPSPFQPKPEDPVGAVMAPGDESLIEREREKWSLRKGSQHTPVLKVVGRLETK